MLCQIKYVLDLLKEYRFLGAKPVKAPIDANQKLKHFDFDQLSSPFEYGKLVGKLLYLIFSRPDISYVAHVLSQFMDKPTLSHLKAAHRVLKEESWTRHFFSNHQFTAIDNIH